MPNMHHLLLLIISLLFLGVASFQGAAPPIKSLRHHHDHDDAPSTRRDGISNNSRLFESAASQWMENEKRIESQIDEETANAAAVEAASSNFNVNEEEYSPHPPSGGRWEELHSNYILRPPNNQQPRALLHFLGGALLGAAPQLSYRYVLERLSSRGYLVVATPYQLSFDHMATCDEIIERFELVAPDLARQYGAVPVVGVGHSCGSLLHMLITSLFPDTPRAANALISYNNRGVSEAIPGFEEFIIPLFSDGDKNGSELMKAMIGVAREQFNGKRFEKVCFGLLGYLSCPHIGSFD